MVDLQFGQSGSIRFEGSASNSLLDGGLPRGEPLADPRSAVRAALDQPLDFPPLSAATVPGDRIVLAVERGVPQAAEVVAGVVETLRAAGADPRSVTVVTCAKPGGGEGPDPRTALPPDVRIAVQWVTHHPDEFSSMAYLAASAEGEAIYVNRWLSDADVLIPIGVLRPENSLGYLGVYGGLFPTFSDEATQRRFRAASLKEWRRHAEPWQQQAQEVAWLIGVQLLVQVIAGAGDSLLHVLAGQPESVAARGRKLVKEAWHSDLDQRVPLVVAALSGGADQQTWDNAARALLAAAAATEEQGVIALCTSLATKPGPALRRLASEDDTRKRRKLKSVTPPDALPASVLKQLLPLYRIFLLSNLAEDTVEELGLGHVSKPEEIARLASRFPSCLILRSAQFAEVAVEE